MDRTSYEEGFRTLEEADTSGYTREDAAFIYARASAHLLAHIADKLEVIANQMVNVQRSLSSIDSKTR
jgi:hypothetical protein